jgi:hypothetical protein
VIFIRNELEAPKYGVKFVDRDDGQMQFRAVRPEGDYRKRSDI